jgi:hypothetical protein
MQTRDLVWSLKWFNMIYTRQKMVQWNDFFWIFQCCLISHYVFRLCGLKWHNTNWLWGKCEGCSNLVNFNCAKEHFNKWMNTLVHLVHMLDFISLWCVNVGISNIKKKWNYNIWTTFIRKKSLVFNKFLMVGMWTSSFVG